MSGLSGWCYRGRHHQCHQDCACDCHISKAAKMLSVELINDRRIGRCLECGSLWDGHRCHMDATP